MTKKSENDNKRKRKCVGFEESPSSTHHKNQVQKLDENDVYLLPW
jgi:hypothetical protein